LCPTWTSLWRWSMRLEAEVREAFTRLRGALEAHLEASLARSRAKEALEMALAEGLLSGEIVGKNAEEREARARSLYPHLYQALQEAEEALLRARAEVEAARAQAEEVALLVRLAALEVA